MSSRRRRLKWEHLHGTELLDRGQATRLGDLARVLDVRRSLREQEEARLTAAAHLEAVCVLEDAAREDRAGSRFESPAPLHERERRHRARPRGHAFLPGAVTHTYWPQPWDFAVASKAVSSTWQACAAGLPVNSPRNTSQRWCHSVRCCSNSRKAWWSGPKYATARPSAPTTHVIMTRIATPR